MLPHRMASKARTLRSAFLNLGVPQAAFYFLQRMRHRRAVPGHPYVVSSKRARHPLHCRAGTSDVEVFGQMFVQREYRCLDDLTSAELVIDCGANVGYSSAYFLSRFAECRVICVEPDPDNFRALEANLAPYAERVTALRAAVWSGKTGLVISEATLGLGQEWGRSVREARAGERATLEAIDIGSLIRDSGHARVSILKIDVEGAEQEIFRAGFEQWIDRVDTLVIELHGRRCEEVFHAAIAGRGFSVRHCDDLTICRRLAPSPS